MAGSVLVLAPRGRDAAIILQVLERSGRAGASCATLDALCAALDHEVGAVVLTEACLSPGPALERLTEWVAAQPVWSDLPLVVLAGRQAGRRTPAAARIIDRLGNVVLLELPVNAETLASAIASALRGRGRQFEARRLAETLESRVVDRTRALESARETLAFALDSAGMGSWDLDLLTDRARCSAMHDRILGLAAPVPDWGRRRFLEVVLPEDRDRVAFQFEAAASSGTLEIQCRIGRPAGDGVEQRWIVARGRMVYDANGNGVRMAGIVMDTTEQRRTEEALRQAQKMEAIGQLTGGVAHDFNNLLTVIVGGLDMIIRKPERTERVVRLAEAAMVAAGRGEQLTQQLLAFSRRQMLRPETIDPVRQLAGFQSLAQRAVGEALKLRFRLVPGCGPILVDPVQFESAVLNLIVNARDAVQEARAAGHPAHGGIVVEARPDANGDAVVVSVTDDGAGFDPAMLPHAFEPFFTTKEVGKGSGLGLAQVYGFMRSAGGEATIESRPGNGTTVQLRFPRAEGTPIPHCPQPGLRALHPASRSETVLLVEDDAEVRAMAIESLEELRYTVLVACDAPEALQRLAEDRRIDLLFSDVVMPGPMDGVALALEARRLRPGIRLLLTSGYVGESGASQLIGGDIPVLTKPYRRDELARTLQLVLEQAAQT